jgi:hypothetical protein
MKKGLKGLVKKAAVLMTASLISLCMVFPVAAATQNDSYECLPNFDTPLIKIVIVRIPQ